MFKNICFIIFLIIYPFSIYSNSISLNHIELTELKKRFIKYRFNTWSMNEKQRVIGFNYPKNQELNTGFSNILKNILIDQDQCVFTYQNKSKKEISPNVSIYIYNKYGMEIGWCHDQWLFSIDPKSADSETDNIIGTFEGDIRSFFLTTDIIVPKNLKERTFIIMVIDNDMIK